MKLILKLLLLLVLGVGAFEGYIWYKVRATVTEAVEAASPFATIYYGDVFSTIFPREMGVNNLQINVQGQVVNLQSVRLKVDSIWDLYAIEKDPQELFQRGLALEVRGLDFTDYYADALSTLAEQEEYADSADRDTCSPMQQASVSDLREMGFERLLVDSEVAVRPATGEGPGGFSLSGRVQEMIEFRMDIDMLLELDNPMMMAMQMQQGVDFNSLSYSLRDLGYSQQWVNLCARRRAQKPDIFVEAHLVEMQEMVAEEFELGLQTGLLEAYRSFLSDGSRVRVDLQPQTSQWLEQLQFYHPEEYATLLGLEVYVDGRRISDGGFTAPPKLAAKPEKKPAPVGKVTGASSGAVAAPEQSAAAQVETSASRNLLTRPEDAIAPMPKAAPPAEMSWQQLASYSGIVEIKTEDGETHKGRVQNWSERRVMLEKWVGSGRFTFPVPRREFSSARPSRAK